MALRTVGSNELEQWRSLLLAAARDIGKTRSHLDLSEMPTVDLSAGRAVKYMEFIREWAAEAETKARTKKLDAYLSAADRRSSHRNDPSTSKQIGRLSTSLSGK